MKNFEEMTTRELEEEYKENQPWYIKLAEREIRQLEIGKEIMKRRKKNPYNDY